MSKIVNVVNQKIHHIVDKDQINEGCFAIVLEIHDRIYGAKNPLRYPLMIGIADKTTAQRISRKLSAAYVDCLNILHGYSGLVSCATCSELHLPASMTFINGSSYCPVCSKEANLKINLKKVKETLIANGVDAKEADRRIALVYSGTTTGGA